MKNLTIRIVTALSVLTLMYGQSRVQTTGSVAKSKISAYGVGGKRELDLVGIGNNPVTVGGNAVPVTHQNAVLFILHDPETGLYWWHEQHTPPPLDAVKESENFAKKWTFVVDADEAITGFAPNEAALTVKQMRARYTDMATAQVQVIKKVEEQYHIIYGGGGGGSAKGVIIGPALGPQFHDDRPWKIMDVEIQSANRIPEGWRLDVRSRAVKVKPGPGLTEFYDANDTGSIFLTPAFELIAPKH